MKVIAFYVLRPRWSSQFRRGAFSIISEKDHFSLARFRPKRMMNETTLKGTPKVVIRPKPTTAPRTFDPASPSMLFPPKSVGVRTSAAPIIIDAKIQNSLVYVKGASIARARKKSFRARPGLRSNRLNRFTHSARTRASIMMTGTESS